jgi:hypothetical protein
MELATKAAIAAGAYRKYRLDDWHGSGTAEHDQVTGMNRSTFDPTPSSFHNPQPPARIVPFESSPNAVRLNVAVPTSGGMYFELDPSPIFHRAQMAIVRGAAFLDLPFTLIVNCVDGEAPSAASSEAVNRQTCERIIANVDEIARESPWGELSERLLMLLDASYNPEEGLAPMNPLSLATLDALVRAAPNLTQPGISLTALGDIWIEWILPEHERFGLECLPEAMLSFAWIQRDDGKLGGYARLFGKMSVDHFVSRDFRQSRLWKLLEKTR